jgi:hypothetical protein
MAKIFEKSAFSREAGFAVSIAPNGTRVLNSFGMYKPFPIASLRESYLTVSYKLGNNIP